MGVRVVGSLRASFARIDGFTGRSRGPRRALQPSSSSAAMGTPGGCKHVVALLDRSWELTLGPSVDMIQDIMLNVIRLEDRLGIATTGGEWLINLEKMAGRETVLTKKIQAANELSPGIGLDQCILLCMEELAAAARSEYASQWLVIFSDAYCGDMDSKEACAARETLSNSEVNIVFVNMRRLSGFYPHDDKRWEAAQRDIDAFVAVAEGRGHELQLHKASNGGLTEREQLMKFLTKIMPYASLETSVEDRRHHEHALVLRQLRSAMETHRRNHGNSRRSTEEIFAQFDTDGSGTLDVKELQRVLKKIGVRLNTTQIEHLASALDHNGDGIDHAELVEFLHGPDSRAEQIARERKQEQYRKRVEETRRQKKLDEEKQAREEARRLIREKRLAEIQAAQLKREEKIRQQGLVTMHQHAQKLSFGGAPSMRTRLENAGAKLGRVSCSLLWHNDQKSSGLSAAADLDLQVTPPHDSEISVNNKESGGGILDITQRADETYPVENVFFEDPHPGHYTVKVSCREGGHTPKNFECAVLVSIPGRVHLKSILHGVGLQQVEGQEVMEGARMVQGTIFGVGNLHAVTVCEFEVLEPEPELVEEPDPEPEPDIPQFAQAEKKLKPVGKALLSSFRDEDEVVEAMDRLRVQPSATHALILGKGEQNRNCMKLRGTISTMMRMDSEAVQRLHAGNPYRVALREMSERVSVARQSALLVHRRETQIRLARTPRVSGLPRCSTAAARDQIHNILSMPHPRWSSREGRPKTAVLQRTSISCWDSEGHMPRRSATATSSESENDDDHRKEARASSSLERAGSSETLQHAACNGADAIFTRVQQHITMETLVGRRPRSSPRRRQQLLQQKEMLRRRDLKSARAWTAALPELRC